MEQENPLSIKDLWATRIIRIDWTLIPFRAIQLQLQDGDDTVREFSVKINRIRTMRFFDDNCDYDWEYAELTEASCVEDSKTGSQIVALELWGSVEIEIVCGSVDISETRQQPSAR